MALSKYGTDDMNFMTCLLVDRGSISRNCGRSKSTVSPPEVLRYAVERGGQFDHSARVGTASR